MSLPKQKNLKPLNLDQRFAIKTFNKECWSMIPQENTHLVGRPPYLAGPPIEGTGEVVLCESDMMIPWWSSWFCYMYIYIYVYTGIYNQIPLFFCAHCLPKKNAIGGGIQNGMTCNRKNKQLQLKICVKFLSVCPTHAWPVSVSSTAAAAHQRRIMVGSNPTYQKKLRHVCHLPYLWEIAKDIQGLGGVS